MKKICAILFAIILVIALPISLKENHCVLRQENDDVIIVITSHTEFLRHEIELGFKRWYQKKTGRNIYVDWRIPGSTGDVIRFIDSTFENSFRVYWESVLHREWNQEVQTSFANHDVDINPKDALSREARNSFLNSNVGCGIDVILGGGVVEHRHEAEMGQTVDSGILKLHPEWFCDEIIPYTLSGDHLWDKGGRWVGTSLTSFGIVFNTDRLHDLHLPKIQQWSDLTAPQLFKQIAMVDPIQSSVVIKCFEMLLQQQMQQEKRRVLDLTGAKDLTQEQLHGVLNVGWDRGLKMIQKIMANSRYFTDNSVSTIWDVSIGNCTAGVVVDFYGRYQKSFLESRETKERLDFVVPKGGSVASPDPISMFRGAPHPDTALAFIEYIVSEEGQDLIGVKVGAPNGPVDYPLCRTPLRKDFYIKEKEPYMSTPSMNPFLDVKGFDYQGAWTAFAFKSIRFLSKVIFMDTYSEMANAWKAIIQAQKEGRFEDAARALATFEDLSLISYDWMKNELAPLLRSKTPMKEIALSTELTRQFRHQYLLAYQQACGQH